MVVFQIPLPGHNNPLSRHFNHPIPTFPAVVAQVAPLFSHSSCPSARERGRWAKNVPIPCGDTVRHLRRGASFVLPLPLSVPIVSSHSKWDVSMQTEEALSFSPALRQLQEATQARSQLQRRLVLELEELAKNYEDIWFRMVQEQEDQWTRMAEQMDTTFGGSSLRWVRPIW